MAVPPTIVVIAHSRPAATERLLFAVTRADIEPGTTLVISVDVADTAASHRVVELAERFRWPHGDQRVLAHDAIGLVGHFHAAGDLSAEYGEIVILEDDLLVGPGFHRWAAAALDRCEDRIAGISLAAPGFDGYRHLPFEPVDDGSDAIFVQVPWYDGMAFSAQMWRRYRDAIAPHDPGSDSRRPGWSLAGVKLHRAFDELDADEWFGTFTRYLVAADRYFLMPRSAHATGTGAPGAHFDAATDRFQVPLAAGAPGSFRFRSLDDSLAVYDDHMEPTAAMLDRLGLGASDWVVDLGGTRDLTGLGHRPVLTSRPAAAAERRWGHAMHPLVMNVVHDEPGSTISLAPAVSVDTGEAGESASLQTLRAHHRLGVRSRRDALRALAPRLGRR